MFSSSPLSLRASIGCRAFTLTELLVSLGVVAILAVLLFSFGSRAIEGARTTQCQANLRQIGAAFQAYVSENNLRMPPAQEWFKPTRTKTNPLNVRYIPHYILEDYKNVSPWVLRCPSVPYDKSISSQYLGGTYSYNDWWDGRRVTDAPNLARALLVADGRKFIIYRKEFVGDAFHPRHGGVASMNIEDFQGRVANVLFADGHVEFVHAPIDGDMVNISLQID